MRVPAPLHFYARSVLEDALEKYARAVLLRVQAEPLPEQLPEE